MRNPMFLLGYILGAAMAVAGVLVLIGVLRLRNGDDSAFSTMFGAVLLLFGIYRIVVTQTKQRRQLRESQDSNRPA